MIAVRIRLLAVPLDRDEGEYAYVGWQILRGVPPFVSIYHVKLPGIHAVYAAIELLFGQTVRGIRSGLLLVNLATLAVVFAIGRRLFGALAGAFAASAFAVLALGLGLDGFSANAEHFLLLPALLGLLALLGARGSRHERAVLFGAGLGLGVATAIKQTGLFFVAAGGLYALASGLAERPRRVGKLVRDAAVFVLGAALPFAVLCLVFLRLGLFERFWWWTFYYPRRYVTQISLADGWGNFWLSFAPDGPRIGVLDVFWPLLLLAGAGALGLVLTGQRRSAAFLGSLLGFSLLAVAAGFHFFPHYYLLATPALALLAGAGAAGVRRRLGRAAAVAVVTGVLGFAVWTQRAYLFSLDPVMVSRTAFGGNPFPESEEIARYLAAHTKPGDRIAVLGSEPQLYFLAKRTAATGYLYTYEMMREHPHVRAFQAEMVREIEAARPKYVVMVNILASWQPSRLAKPDRFVFEWAARYLREHYRRVGVVEIRWPQQRYGSFCWEAPDRACRPPRGSADASPLWLGIHERLPDVEPTPAAGLPTLSPPASDP